MAMLQLMRRGETSRASPQLIPAPDPPQLSVKLPPESRVEGAGKPSASFDRNCTPCQVPIRDHVDQFPLAYGQLREN